MKYLYRCILLTAILLIPLFSAPAQEGLTWEDEDFLYLEPGDQNFTFKGGAKFPLFLYLPDSDSSFVTDKFTIAGWSGSIGWERMVTSKTALGVELGYSSNRVVSGDRLIQVPIFFTTTWYPLQDQFEIPLSLKTGVVYSSLNDLGEQVYFGPIAAPTAGIQWRALSSWSFGLEASYWFVPELYFGTERRENTAYGNFLTLSFVASFTSRGM